MKPLVDAFVIIDKDGNPVLDTGRYTEKPVKTKRSTTNATGDAGDDTPNDTGLKPLSEKLVAELAIQRRDVLALHVANNPAVAMDYMIFAIADTGRSYGEHNDGTTLSGSYPQTYCQTYPVSAAHTQMADVQENLEKSWTEHPTTVERFDAFCALTDDDKAAWLAYCVARTIEPSIGVSRRSGQNGPELLHLHDRLAQLLEIEVAHEWRPTSANYFDRVSKAAILAHIGEVGTQTMAASYASSKKADLSASAEKIFSGTTIVDAAVKEAALAWVPDHMRFNLKPVPDEAAPANAHQPIETDEEAREESQPDSGAAPNADEHCEEDQLADA